MILERGLSTNPCVLIVDDERQVLESLADLLRKEFHVLATDDAEEALRLLPKNDIALLVTDQRMPRVTGVELLTQARALSPDTVRVLLTAYSDIQAVIQAVNEGCLYYYLAKPWDSRQVLELVRTATQHYRTVAQRRLLVEKLAEVNRLADAPPDQPPERSPSGDAEAEVTTLERSLDHLRTAFEDLRKLQQMIPLCMKCGKIKTSKANWEAVVDYLGKNRLVFSHGYCPACQAELMAEWGVNG